MDTSARRREGTMFAELGLERSEEELQDLLRRFHEEAEANRELTEKGARVVLVLLFRTTAC